ncbi:MAG: hypothetical protein LIO59_01490 [Oscillospiraceae bacterium]|nr:hypothetical protein [Oscillospiraceae bacterium]
MKYRFINDKLQLVRYIMAVIEEHTAPTEDGEETVTDTIEFTAATEEERDKLLTRYPDATVEEIDNTGYEYLESTSWTPEQIANGELDTAIEDGELPMSQEEINAMLILEIAALKAGGTE